MALQLSDPFLFATPLLVFIPRVLVPLSPSILRAVRSVHAAQLVYPPVHWEDGHLGSPPLAAASRSQGPSKDRNYTPSFLIDLPPTGPSIRRSVSTFPFEPDRLSFRNRIDPRFVRGRVPILRPASLHFFSRFVVRHGARARDQQRRRRVRGACEEEEVLDRGHVEQGASRSP